MTENVAKSRSARITGRIFFYIVVVILLFFVLFPMFWMFLASFKTNADILNMSKLFNFTPTMKNFENVFVNYDFAKPIINSLIVSLVSTVLSLILGLPAAYSIAREKQHLFSGIILMIRIVPAVSFLVPWYILFTNLHLSGTYLSLIICHLIVSLPLIVWIMIPYYETLPQELEQSAYIDGASRFGTFIRIMLPLSTPGILTSGILAFIFSWNNCSLLQRYYYAAYRDLSVYFLFQRRLGRYHVRFRGYHAAYYHYFLLPPALHHHRTYCGRRQGLIRRQIKSILYGVNQT